MDARSAARLAARAVRVARAAATDLTRLIVMSAPSLAEPREQLAHASGLPLADPAWGLNAAGVEGRCNASQRRYAGRL